MYLFESGRDLPLELTEGILGGKEEYSVDVEVLDPDTDGMAVTVL